MEAEVPLFQASRLQEAAASVHFFTHWVVSSLFAQWQGETQEFCPNAKVVLVGCKLDMRTDVATLRELSKQRLIPVTHEQVSSRETPRREGKSFGWVGVGVGLG